MRHVLVASLGGSPQVLTEALWALMNPGRLEDPAHRGRAAVAPDRIVILATTLAWPFRSVEERDATIRERIGALYLDQRRPPPAVEIRQIEDEGRALADIRNQRENIVYANTVSGVVRALAEEELTVVHMLLAGGRKSMSSYDQSAMMFFGRARDELFHVLVEPDALERCRDFWWPGQPEKLVATAGGDRYATDAEAARVDLVTVPFVRLGVRLPAGAPVEALDYEKLVEFVQFEQAQAPVILDLDALSVTAGGETVHLTAGHFTLVATLAVIRKAGWAGAGPPGEDEGANAGGWTPLDALRYGLAAKDQPRVQPALALAKEIWARVSAKVTDGRQKKQDPDEKKTDWIARAESALPGEGDETGDLRARCADAIREGVANPFIAGLIAPASNGHKRAKAAVGLLIAPERLELRGFEPLADWLSGARGPRRG